MGYESPDALMTVQFSDDGSPNYPERRFAHFCKTIADRKLADGTYRHRDLGLLTHGVWLEEVLPDVVGNMRFQRFTLTDGEVRVER